MRTDHLIDFYYFLGITAWFFPSHLLPFVTGCTSDYCDASVSTTLVKASQPCQYQFISNFTCISQSGQYWPYHYTYETIRNTRTRTQAHNRQSIKASMFDVNENSVLIISAFCPGSIKDCTLVHIKRWNLIRCSIVWSIHRKTYARTSSGSLTAVPQKPERRVIIKKYPSSPRRCIKAVDRCKRSLIDPAIQSKV